MPGGGIEPPRLIQPRDFKSGQKAPKGVGRNRKEPETEGGTGKPAPPLLYLFGGGRQGLLHILLHSPKGGVGPHDFVPDEI